MRELKLKETDKLEISIKHKKKIERQFAYNIIPHKGHTVWEINEETLEMQEAKYFNANYEYGKENKKEIVIKDGFSYVSALNKKSALNKLKKNANGSKIVYAQPLNFSY